MQKRVPYLPFRTFNNFLEELRVSGLPNRIDRGGLAGKSRSMQSQILSALNYLGLTDATGATTQDFDRLIRSSGLEREQAWREILRSSYSRLFELDVEVATTEEFLDALLKEGSNSEATLRKALNFFSLATRSAGIRISPHVKPYAGKRQSARDVVSTKARLKVVSLPLPRKNVATVNASQNLDLLLSKFPEFDPSWPSKEREGWLEGFQGILRILGEEEKRDERAIVAKKDGSEARLINVAG
jgi:hypothetical protein